MGVDLIGEGVQCSLCCDLIKRLVFCFPKNFGEEVWQDAAKHQVGIGGSSVAILPTHRSHRSCGELSSMSQYIVLSFGHVGCAHGLALEGMSKIQNLRNQLNRMQLAVAGQRANSLPSCRSYCLSPGHISAVRCSQQ